MKISEVSKTYNISIDTLRYYEKTGLIPAVPRDQNGLRNYDEASCQWVEFIKCMRSAGLPIDVLSEYVKLFRQGDKTLEARKNLLMEQREILCQKIEAMQKTLERLDYKISLYEKHDVGI